jgi:U2 small nuclear ribonucleoprotein A'
MVRLTADLIARSPAFINTLREFELDLRGNKIPIIENLGATEDQYDLIDLSDNEITKLEGFPLLKKLHTLFLNNNRINRIGTGLGEVLPNLETLILTNNRIHDLADLDPLAELKKLRFLSLIGNPVTKKHHYRLYVIHKLPNLRFLDFSKVKLKERQSAEQLFGGDAGKKLQEKIAKARTFVPGESEKYGMTPEQKQMIIDAIQKARTMEEVTRLEHALQTGKFPKELFPGAVAEPTPTSEGQSTTSTEHGGDKAHEAPKQP